MEKQLYNIDAVESIYIEYQKLLLTHKKYF